MIRLGHLKNSLDEFLAAWGVTLAGCVRWSLLLAYLATKLLNRSCEPVVAEARGAPRLCLACISERAYQPIFLF